jgi:hypothetical protein
LLLLAGLVRRLAPAEAATRVPIPEGLIETLLRELVREHRNAWSREYAEAPDLLRDAVLDLLQRMLLVVPAEKPAGGGWMLAAAAARYAPEVTT